MSIKPVAMIPEDEMQCLIDGHTAIVIPVGDALPDEVCTLLYAIPDTHRVVSVELLRLACAWLSVYTPPELYNELCAIIEDKP